MQGIWVLFHLLRNLGNLMEREFSKAILKKVHTSWLQISYFVSEVKQSKTQDIL